MAWRRYAFFLKGEGLVIQKPYSVSCDKGRGGHRRFSRPGATYLIVVLLCILPCPTAALADETLSSSDSATLNIRVSVAPVYRLKAIRSDRGSIGVIDRRHLCFWTNAVTTPMPVMAVSGSPTDDRGARKDGRLVEMDRGAQIFPCAESTAIAVSEHDARDMHLQADWIMIRPE